MLVRQREDDAFPVFNFGQSDRLLENGLVFQIVVLHLWLAPRILVLDRLAVLDVYRVQARHHRGPVVGRGEGDAPVQFAVTHQVDRDTFGSRTDAVTVVFVVPVFVDGDGQFLHGVLHPDDAIFTDPDDGVSGGRDVLTVDGVAVRDLSVGVDFEVYVGLPGQVAKRRRFLVQPVDLVDRQSLEFDRILGSRDRADRLGRACLVVIDFDLRAGQRGLIVCRIQLQDLRHDVGEGDCNGFRVRYGRIRIC